MRRVLSSTTLLVIGFVATFLVTRMTREGGRLDGEASGRRAVPPTATAPSPLGPPPGMAWVPGGEFTVGSDDPNAAPAERPAHRVRVDGF